MLESLESARDCRVVDYLYSARDSLQGTIDSLEGARLFGEFQRHLGEC